MEVVGSREEHRAVGHPVPLGELVRTFLWIGTVGFGGGYAVLDLIRTQLVERRRWLTSQQYDHVVSLAEMAPGALTVNVLAGAAYRLGGIGAMLAGTGALILPSFLIIVLCAGLYTAYAGAPVVQGALHGLEAAVVALMLVVAWELSRGIRPQAFQLGVGAVTFGAYLFLNVNPIFLLLAAGVAGAWRGGARR
ncbi:MAG: chromate transporter [Thermaerobacter sp.]|nr:chromate transporter [Thermaerobacter sp.]